MNGRAEFNEVFLTDARVPQENLLGDEGDGWRVALEILGHERASMDADTGGGMIPALDLSAPAGSFVGRRPRSEHGNEQGDAHGNEHGDEDEVEDSMRSAVGVPARRLLGDLLDRSERRGDPVARQRVAGLTTLIEIARFGAGTIEPSTGKLAGTQLVRGVRDTALGLLGPHGTLAGHDAPLDGLVTDMALTVPSMSIAGGTDEIQRNIVGERVLGLPPEPRVDKDVPFRDLPKA